MEDIFVKIDQIYDWKCLQRIGSLPSGGEIWDIKNDVKIKNLCEILGQKKQTNIKYHIFVAFKF